MKNNLFISCLFYFLFSLSTFASTSYTVNLNGLIYEPKHTIIEQNNQPYVALSDLASMLFIGVTSEGESYHLSTATGTLSLRANYQAYTFNHTKAQLPHAPRLINDILYIPMDLLSIIGYPCSYDIDENTLSLTTLTPLSRNKELTDKHLFVATTENLEQLPSHVKAFSSEKAITTELDAALKSESYIAFTDKTLQNSVRDYFTPRLKYSPYDNMHVVFRHIDSDATPTHIDAVVSLPLEVTLTSQGLSLLIGEEVFDYPMYWATYSPAHSFTEQNISKTAETTIIRALYEYYRNTYDLRDDKYFSPFTVLSSDQTNTFKHGVYTLDSNNHEVHYDLFIHRVHPSGAMYYVIDLVKK